MVSFTLKDETMQNDRKNQGNCEFNFNFCSNVSKDIKFGKTKKVENCHYEDAATLLHP